LNTPVAASIASRFSASDSDEMPAEGDRAALVRVAALGLAVAHGAAHRRRTSQSNALPCDAVRRST